MKTPKDRELQIFLDFMNGVSIKELTEQQNYKHTGQISKIILDVSRFLLEKDRRPKYELDTMKIATIKNREMYFKFLIESYIEALKQRKPLIDGDDESIMRLTKGDFLDIVHDAVYSAILDVIPKNNSRIIRMRKVDYLRRKNGRRRKTK